ncbi:hypothetical protein BB561_002919 [Smittium simulii]|uniref:Histone deacetylase complex subunit SAP30 Sin3 binding domain-containing protein n=1 Tax=Smittium simulii TaxID=133385 RepID=A0A2T9YNN7_9FUNG|nr:hypothetical protein BB561_002919 [Smittium simulii]
MPPKNKISQVATSTRISKPVSTSSINRQPTKLDFNGFSMNLLRKYRQVYKLNIKARSSKEELVSAAAEHHSQLLIDEVDTIASPPHILDHFIVKTYCSGGDILDHFIVKTYCSGGDILDHFIVKTYCSGGDILDHFIVKTYCSGGDILDHFIVKTYCSGGVLLINHSGSIAFMILL